MARAPALQTTEVFPEADRLDGFPHPRTTALVFGHDEPRAQFVADFDAGHLHHAWLLTGPQGIGKATLAYALAAYALADPATRARAKASGHIDPANTTLRQIQAKSHAGLFVISRSYDFKSKKVSAQIRVDDVRRLRSFLQLSSGGGGWRVVLVDTADDLNIAAANALLKSLEEPPPRTVFLLGSSEPGRLLNTIRSRCQTCVMNALDDTALAAASRQALAAADDPDTTSAIDVAALMPLAGGSVRHLLDLGAGGGAQMSQDVWRLLSSLPNTDWRHAHTLSDTLSGTTQTERFELFFGLLQDQIAALIRAAATADGGAQITDLSTKLIKRGQLARWAALWETVAAEKAQTMALNLDRKTLILSTLSRLEDAVGS